MEVILICRPITGYKLALCFVQQPTDGIEPTGAQVQRMAKDILPVKPFYILPVKLPFSDGQTHLVK